MWRSLISVFLVLVMAREARAQGILDGLPTVTPSELFQNEQKPIDRSITPKEAPGSVKLFDARRSQPGFQIEVGQLWFRGVSTRDPFQRGVAEIFTGVTSTTPWGPFYLSGIQQLHLRLFESGKVAFSIPSGQLASGVRLGPIEAGVRIGMSALTVDVFDGSWGIQLFSPRVGAEAAVRLGPVRFDLEIHSEYFWRWFGQSYIIRGISLGVRFESNPKLPTFGANGP